MIGVQYSLYKMELTFTLCKGPHSLTKLECYTHLRRTSLGSLVCQVTYVQIGFYIVYQ